MKRSGLLLSFLALLLVSGSAGAQLAPSEGEAPAVISQGKGKGKYPPIKDEDGNEIQVPEFDQKAMQCAVKCQEPTAKCMSACSEDNNKCKGKCATALEACTRKCNVKPKK